MTPPHHVNPDDAPNLWGDNPPPAVIPISVPDDATPRQKFEAFHALNGWVYHDLVFLARDYRERGRDKGAIEMLFNIVRWQRGRRTQGDEFKLNNNYKSFYSRLIMATEPDLAGFFNIREQRPKKGT